MSKKSSTKTVGLMQSSLHSHGQSGENQTVYTCRRELSHFLEKFLTDINSIRESLKKYSGQTSDCIMLLQLCSHQIKNNPDNFLTSPHPQADDTPPLPETRPGYVIEEEKLSYAFSTWFYYKLLRPLGYEECSVIHSQCISVITAFLQMIRWRDSYFYSKLLSDLIYCISDLVQINERFYNSEDDTFEAQLSRLQVSMEAVQHSLIEPDKREEKPEVTVSTVSFDVPSVEVCECYQLNFVKMLEGLITDISSVANHLVPVTWGCLCWNMEYGDLELKTRSLVCIGQLSDRGLPSPQVLDYFISCVMALMDFICSGCKNAEEKLRVDLEKKLGDTLQKMIKADRTTLHQTHLSFSQYQYLLSKTALSLTTNGLTNILTPEFKQSLVTFICHCFDGVPSKVLSGSIFQPLRNAFVISLLNYCGKTNKSQFVVQALVKLVMCEFGHSSSSESHEERSTTEEKAEGFGKGRLTVSQNRRKRKADEADEMVKYKPTKLQKAVTSKLKLLTSRLMGNLSEDSVGNVLEGIRTCVEVLLNCLHQCRHRDKQASTEYYSQHAKDSSAVFHNWLSAVACQSLLEGVANLLGQCSDWSSDTVNQVLCYILKTFSALLCENEVGDLTNEEMLKFCWMASLPWLPNDPSWMDLKIANTKQVAKISHQLSDKLDRVMKTESLRVLSLLPKDVSPKWRVHVFRQACSDSDTKKAAMLTFPMLLQHLGPNANHLVYELVHPLVGEVNEDLRLAVAETSGILACVVCRKTTINKKKSDQSRPLYLDHIIQCVACDQLHANDTCRSSKDRPKLVDPNMFSTFLSLLKSEDTAIKTALIDSLTRMFGHIGLRTNNVATVNMLNTCLGLIEDKDYSIRVQFSKVVTCLVGEGSNDTNQLMVKKVKDAFNSAQMSGNIRLQETILLTVAQLGRVAEDDLLLVVIISLLESLLSKTPLIAAVAYEQLKLVAQHKKTKTQNLFMKSRLPICKFLVEAMHTAQTSGGRAPEEILRDVSRVLDFSEVKSFLQVASKYMVPHLVSKATSEASTLIKMMATILNIPSRVKLLLDQIKYVFAYLVCYCNKTEMERAITFLQNETDFELGGLLRLHFQRVHQQLLLHLSTHYSQVFNGLRLLATYDDNYAGPKDITTSEQMADYLQPRLLGVIAFFDSQLLTASIPLEDKKLTLDSLTSIIRLMGQRHIGSIRHKLVNTLRTGLQYKDRELMEVSCRAWHCFIRSLEVPFLGQMMSQIIATLLPLLETLAKPVCEIINFMIVDNRRALGEHFHEIYFLPDIPELADANAILKQYMEGPSSQSDLKTLLTHSMKGISHESVDVRRHALSKLKKLLREEKEALYQYVIGNETADPIITQLVSVLLEGCRESDSRAQCLYAECIGELGAIDPGRLELMTNDPKAEIAKFQASITDDNFIIGLINEGVKAFLAATETRIQDCAAFALQEILKIYKITEPGDSEPSSGKIWKRFAEHVKEILVPFFTSKYALSKPRDWSKQSKPIYNSEKGHHFHDWVSTWTGYLSSKVKSDSAKEVFLACSAAIKHFDDMALYILPHVVLQVLQDGSKEDIADILAEITEVLTHANKPDSKHRAANFYHLSAQTVFSVLDYLTKWLHYIIQTKALAQTSRAPGYLSDVTYRSIKSFLQMIPQDLLADACFNCKAYTRALMHFEQFLNTKNKNIEEHLDFMQRLYVAMDEPDGVLGVAAIRKSHPTLKEQILTHESQGQHQDAQSCYEKAIQKEADDAGHHQGLVRCLMEQGQQSQALYHATAAINERHEWAPHLNSYMVEAAWKLGSWQKLETYIKADKNSRQWSVGIGKILLAARDRKEEELKKHLQIVRRDQLGPLSAASMESGSYHRGYEYIARLHMLSEVEKGVQVLMNLYTEDNSEPQKQSTTDLLQHWESRLQIVQCSFRTQEPILTLRRILFTLAQETAGLETDHDIGHWWLWSAKIAQKAGYLQMAYSSLLQASDYQLPEVFLEKAQWLWHKGDKDKAISTLERGNAFYFSDISQLKLDQSDQAKNKLKVYAKALLLYGCYSEETSCLESNAILKLYKEVTEVYPDWEDGHFHLAKYYDKIMTTVVEDKDRPDPSRQGEFFQCVVRSFGQSLKYGNQYIYQSMPRLLSLWLDFGTSVAEVERRARSGSSNQQVMQKLQSMRNTLVKLNRIISNLGQQLAPYQLFTAFSQLISRICHAQPDVFQQLKEIIAALFAHFPQQGLWMMMAVSKSSYHIRVNRCQDIFASAVQLNPDLHKFIQDGTKLTEKLLDLCNRETPAGTATVSVIQHFKPLKRLLDDRNFSKIILPLQSAMTVMLPNTPGSHRDHNPFPEKLVYISGIEDTIEILQSLQRPKKITLMGTDGQLYVMMCKPKDDLRKDCRLMEFNAIVNKFLHKDPESRKRQLHIRTYAVVPLNEECGLIEWVNNTSGLRYILLKIYREKGIYTSGKELKAMMPKITDSIDVKMQMFKEKMLPRHPPVFKEWFLRTFPDPTSWYNARLSYARTSAVISMVGYILGLGDRHGENILFDSTNGDCVHVDFNCLFNKGETFEWAEKVPFRLTHNMMDALGPLGYEGIFRRSCEVTLRVMRTQMDPLMSVLKPFVYDPLVEWSKPAKGQRSNPTDTGEINNEKAMTHVQNIEHRLKGILKYKASKPRTVPLSIEGHVNYLIHEATDEKNLCEMYIGWAPYL